MTDGRLVVWRDFVWRERPPYVERYVRQHTRAPEGASNPVPKLKAYFRERPSQAVRIAWTGAWDLIEFEGWDI